MNISNPVGWVELDLLFLFFIFLRRQVDSIYVDKIQVSSKIAQALAVRWSGLLGAHFLNQLTFRFNKGNFFYFNSFPNDTYKPFSNISFSM